VSAEAPLLGSALHPANRQHASISSSSGGGSSGRSAPGLSEQPARAGNPVHRQRKQSGVTPDEGAGGAAAEAKRNFLWRLLPGKMRQGRQQLHAPAQGPAAQPGLQHEQQRQAHQEAKLRLMEHLKETKALMEEQLSARSMQHRRG